MAREETWSRESVEAYGYSNFEGSEGWTILASKNGTAGTLYTVCLARQVIEPDGEEYIFPEDDYQFVGVDAYERAAECYGFRC